MVKLWEVKKGSGLSAVFAFGLNFDNTGKDVFLKKKKKKKGITLGKEFWKNRR
jgi:hypothetical protein